MLDTSEHQNLSVIRDILRGQYFADESQILTQLVEQAQISSSARANARQMATDLVTAIRKDDAPGLMEVFLAEYGLSTNEGVALMCLAEALLRVPDSKTIDELIEDKIVPSQWGEHLGRSSSSLVNASTWALLLTGKTLEKGEGVAATLKGAIRRLGEPVIRAAVSRAIKEMGNQFVLGETIDAAMERGQSFERKGYTYSYDMLGEAALTAEDAETFYTAYLQAIERLSRAATHDDIRKNPGISIKLSALHPRYEAAQKSRVMSELVPRVLSLAKAAKASSMGFNIDAEEAERLDLSLDVIESVLSEESLRGWNGFGIVVQAYGKRAAPVLDWIYALSEKLDRQIMVRLVKGAYWDTEIKKAQVEGLADFPVFTSKSATDVSYICCAKKLLEMTDRIYPQFATHNAHTVCAVVEIAREIGVQDSGLYEFQKLHGMGESLYKEVIDRYNVPCRIYAPVGAHRDLLAYLVRRLLENGANSSFVNQIVDKSIEPEIVATDPFEKLGGLNTQNHFVKKPSDLYEPERKNSKGWDLLSGDAFEEIDAARSPFRDKLWFAGPLTVSKPTPVDVHPVINPADPSDKVGEIALASDDDIKNAISDAKVWDAPQESRALVLNKAADLYEAHFGEFFAILAREAGKTPTDVIAELREAVDFLRYYAARALELETPARGIISCISPWNFPLAIFTGQISAALAAGNAVLAKPAESTPIVAHKAISLLIEAGVPQSAIQLLPGPGRRVGAALSSDPRISGFCFTGSTATAQTINSVMAENLSPSAPLIAETGGLNAMIVDSTALPEQAVLDIINSAFRSAGQRCSALRVLYLQDDISSRFLKMLFGAMDELKVGQPWEYNTDVGPVIDRRALGSINAHIDQAVNEGRVLKRLSVPDEGTFAAPTVIRIGGIGDLTEEIFGPVLHVATFKASEIDQVVDDINASGYGLTFGIHSRIDGRIEQVISRLNVGNVYVNRNQIGAIVGSQPFGGEGLSGTGPKAGGPNYVRRFADAPSRAFGHEDGNAADIEALQSLLLSGQSAHPEKIDTLDMAGPTGESNRLSIYGRGTILCLGPTADAATAQAEIVRGNGCRAILCAPGVHADEGVDGVLPANALETLKGFDAVVCWGQDEYLKNARIALAKRAGVLVPLITEADFADRCHLERHVCVDTTASGGNAQLLMGAGGSDQAA